MSFSIADTSPLIGGQLAEPVPRILSESHTLFAKYPYFLPALVVSALTAVATISAYMFLTETLVRQPLKKAHGGFRELISYKPFQKVALLYSLNNGVMFSWEAIYPLFLYTRWSLGGLGLTVSIAFLPF